jgi:heme/copper-type cytochrome/quinol oxidase subunit 2
MNRVLRIAAILALAAILVPALLSACPLCKEAEADTPGGSASLGRGFYYSILLMIAVPWTAVGTVAFLIFRKRRRARTSEPVSSEAGAGPQDLSPRHSPVGARS